MSAAGVGGAARPAASPYLVAALVALGTFMEVKDSTALSVALPQVAGSLAVSAEESDWVLNSYLVANAAIMPLSAWAAERFGRKRFYIGCIIAFTLSSLLCGMAWSLESLVLFRVFQGMAAAGNAASEAAIIADAFPPEKRGMGFAIYGLAIVVAPTIGPTFGGWVSDNHTWRWIFYSNLPVGLLAVALSLVFIQDSAAAKARTAERRKRGWRLDWAGFALCAIGLGCLELVLDRGQQEDWFASGWITTAAVVATVCLLILPAWELTRKEPVLDLTLFRDPNFTAVFLAFGLTGVMIFGATTVLPLMLQQVFGYPATTAGLALMLGGVATMVMMPLAGALTGKVPTAWLGAVGFTAATASLFLMANLYDGYDFWTVSLLRVVQTVAVAFLFVPLQGQGYVGLRPEQLDQASALLNLARNLGGSIGTALGVTILERRRQYHQGVLAEEATPENPAYESWRAAAEQAGLAADPQALDALLLQEVQRQASTLAFNDVFFVFGIVVGLGSLVLFLIRGKPEAGSPAG